MTREELQDHVNTYRVLRSLKADISPEEIDRAANLAQAEILRECLILEETVTPTFIIGQELYDGSETGWEFINRLIKPKCGYNLTGMEPIEPVDKEWVDWDRIRVAKGGAKPTPPMYVYTVMSSVVQLGFWGEPQTAAQITLTYFRGQGAADAMKPAVGIIPAVDPIIPIGYEKLLVIGTVAQLLDFRREFNEEGDSLALAFDKFSQIYENEKNKARITRAINSQDSKPALKSVRF